MGNNEVQVLPPGLAIVALLLVVLAFYYGVKVIVLGDKIEAILSEKYSPIESKLASILITKHELMLYDDPRLPDLISSFCNYRIKTVVAVIAGILFMFLVR